jgi:hypothetical protein
MQVSEYRNFEHYTRCFVLVFYVALPRFRVVASSGTLDDAVMSSGTAVLNYRNHLMRGPDRLVWRPQMKLNTWISGPLIRINLTIKMFTAPTAPKSALSLSSRRPFWKASAGSEPLDD